MRNQLYVHYSVSQNDPRHEEAIREGRQIDQLVSSNLEVKRVVRGAGAGGKGLYARRSYKKGDYIIAISGELFSSDENRSVEEDK